MTDNTSSSPSIISPKPQNSSSRWVLLRIIHQQKQKEERWSERWHFWIVLQNLVALFFCLLACYAFGPNESWAFVAYDELRGHYSLRDSSLTERATATVIATKEPNEAWYTFTPAILPDPSSSSSSYLYRKKRPSPYESLRTFFSPPGDFFLSSWLVDVLDPEPVRFSCHRLLGINERWGSPCYLPPSLFERAQEGKVEVVYLVNNPSFNAPLDERGEVVLQPSEFYYSAILLVALFLVDFQILVGMVVSGMWLWEELRHKVSPAPPPPTREEDPVFQWLRVGE